MRRTLYAVAVVFCAYMTPQAVEAQVSFEVGPYFGLYAPTASFGSAPFSGPFFLPAQSRQGSAALVGAKAAVWLGRRVGLGVQWGTASSTVRTRDETSIQMEQPARLSFGAVQLLIPLEIASLERRGRARLSGGVGLVRRSGEFYDAYDDSESTAGVLGVGSDFAVAGPAHLTLDFEAYLYSLQLRQPGIEPFESGFQTDLLARVGLVLQLGR
jgi:hypothetical protein